MSIVNDLKDIIRTVIGEVPTKKLIKRGMKVGKNFNRQQGCFIDPTHCWLVSIGDDVTFSIRVTVLAHDASTKLVTGYTKIGKVKIGNNVFVGANSTILPGIEIGDNVVVGANSVVTKNIPGGCVVAGNPARVIHTLGEYSEKVNADFLEAEKFSEEYTMRGNITGIQKAEMLKKLEKSVGYIE